MSPPSNGALRADTIHSAGIAYDPFPVLWRPEEGGDRSLLPEDGEPANFARHAEELLSQQVDARPSAITPCVPTRAPTKSVTGRMRKPTSAPAKKTL